ncbi:hypothetical protein H5410_003904 [Solanum commersonii]|uniref:Uncharacterized protein n=1 Tax=Solanum commersonii TaxID=4109 RepID=A0A9J6B6E8_SOLCO|nr:hypothetical protein H5410_003904 [Solanum commersonii]
MTYNIDVHTSKKISQPLKCMRQGEGEGRNRRKRRSKENKKEKEKVKKKKKEKKVEVISCDVKQQYSFKGFNIDGEGPTELMSSFSQWINKDKDDHYLVNCSDLEFKQLDFVVAFPKKKDWFYIMSQPNKCWTDEYVDVILYYLWKNDVPEYENQIVGTIKGFGITVGLHWHLINEVLAVIVLKERHIKVYDSMSSSKTNKIFAPRFKVVYIAAKSYMLLGLPNKQAIVYKYHIFFVLPLLKCGVNSDGLQVPSGGISSETVRMRYVSLLWNYGILKAQSGYVSNNEDPQRPRPKKQSSMKMLRLPPLIRLMFIYTIIKVVVAIFSTTSVVIYCNPLLQQGVVALIISSLSLISSQPNATSDSIIRSAIGKPFDTFRIMLKQIGLEDFFRNSYFCHFLDLPKKNNAHFQMTMIYELLKRRFIFRILKRRMSKKGEKEETRQLTEEKDLVSLVGIKNPDLIYVLNHEDTSKKHKESLCLLWFVHNVLWAKDVNNNISLTWVSSNYRRDLISKDIEMVESNIKTVKNPSDLYNPPHDAGWLKPYLILLWIESKWSWLEQEPLKETVDNELFVFDGVDGGGIDVGVGVDVGGDIGVGARQDQGATSCRRSSSFLFEKCKKLDEDSIMYLQTLSQAVNEFKNKRRLKVILSKNVRHPYTPHAKRRKKSFIKAIQNLKKKIFGELPMAVGEEMLEFKHVNVYKRVSIAQKNNLIELSRAKDLRAQYDMHFFSGEDFRTMTSIKIWHVRYPEYYDSTDKILDLNFYFNFKLRYDKISEEATTIGGRSLTQLINEFEWNEDMINYVRGVSPYPGDMD